MAGRMPSSTMRTCHTPQRRQEPLNPPKWWDSSPRRGGDLATSGLRSSIGSAPGAPASMRLGLSSKGRRLKFVGRPERFSVLRSMGSTAMSDMEYPSRPTKAVPVCFLDSSTWFKRPMRVRDADGGGRSRKLLPPPEPARRMSSSALDSCQYHASACAALPSRERPS